MATKYPRFGIDLGTTNSSIGVWSASGFEVFQNRDRMNATPSAVYSRTRDQLLVGRKALEFMERDPESGIEEFKRSMGNQEDLLFLKSGEGMNATQLSAEVLRSMVQDVHQARGMQVTSAVITVPSAFGVLQCQATVEAAKLAGIQNTVLLQEPVAAAIAYGIRPGVQDENWLVFDLGGGTFDVAVVTTKGRQLSVLSHAGDRYLGGKDVDKALVRNVILPAIEKHFSLSGLESDTYAYRTLFQRLSTLAEEAKIALTNVNSYALSVFGIGDDTEGNSIELDIEITREDLEDCLEDAVDRCIELSRKAIAEARLDAKQVKKVLLVGGATQIPYIRKTITEKLGIDLDTNKDPILAVVEGAAYYAATQESIPVSSDYAESDATVEVEMVADVQPGASSGSMEGLVEPSGQVSHARLELQGSEWACKWVPVVDGRFAIPIEVDPNKPIQIFTLTLKDSNGLEFSPASNEMVVQARISVGQPTLQHSIWLEVNQGGEPTFDLVFEKGCLLPAESTDHQYRAAFTIYGNSDEGFLPIKLWEGERPHVDTLTFVGTLKLNPTSPIIKGSEIQLGIKIDASRILSIMAFLLHSGEVIPLELTLPDLMAVRKRQLLVQERIWLDRKVVSTIRDNVTVVSNDDLFDRCQQLENELVDLDVQLSRSMGEADEVDSIVDRQKSVKASILTFLEELDRREGGSPGTKSQGTKSISIERIKRIEQEIVQVLPDVQDPVAVDEMQSLLGEVRQLEQKLPREQERIVEYAERHLTRVRAQKIEYWITYFCYLSH